MKKKLETIVFFGNERLATGVSTKTPTLTKLLDAGYNVAAVVANFETAKSRKSRDLEIAEIASKNNIPILLPKKLSDIKEKLQEYNASAGILVAYGKIIPQEIIDMFPSGIINIHPSLLPKHRGPTPIESVILDGSKQTGVSIMQLSKDMDAGPIYVQEEVKLSGKETKQELADSLIELGGEMLITSLPGILAGVIIPKQQNTSGATYDCLIDKSFGIIDWSKEARLIEREIRAYQTWPTSRTTLKDLDLIIISAHTAENKLLPGEILSTKTSLIIGCGTDSLSIDRLKPIGKNELDISQFLAGYGSRFNN